MLRLTRLTARVIKQKSNHLRDDKIDLSNLSVKQFDEIKNVIATVDDQDHKSTLQEHQQGHQARVRSHVPFRHWHDGKSPRSKAKNNKVQFESLGYPNYPGDPLPFRMRTVDEHEVNRRRQIKMIYKQEAMSQFAPFRRTLYNMSRASQEILPKALVDAATSEFISVSKGNAVRKYHNTGNTETIRKNLFSSFKQTNPRFTARFDQCMITGRFQGLIPRYKLHRMFFRKFADANQICGLRVAQYGPIPNNCQNTYLKHWNKKLNRKYDDGVEY